VSPLCAGSHKTDFASDCRGGVQPSMTSPAARSSTSGIGRRHDDVMPPSHHSTSAFYGPFSRDLNSLYYVLQKLNSTGPTRTPTPTSSPTSVRGSSRGSRRVRRAQRQAVPRRSRPVQLADLSADFCPDARFSSRGCPLGMRAFTRVRVLAMISYRVHVYKITR